MQPPIINGIVETHTREPCHLGPFVVVSTFSKVQTSCIYSNMYKKGIHLITFQNKFVCFFTYWILNWLPQHTRNAGSHHFQSKDFLNFISSILLMDSSLFGFLVSAPFGTVKCNRLIDCQTKVSKKHFRTFALSGLYNLVFKESHCVYLTFFIQCYRSWYTSGMGFLSLERRRN